MIGILFGIGVALVIAGIGFGALCGRMNDRDQPVDEHEQGGI